VILVFIQISWTVPLVIVADLTDGAFPRSSYAQSSGPATPPQITLRRVFQNLSFIRPVHLTSSLDGTDRIFVVEQAGRIKVFPNDYETSASNVFLDIRDRVNSSPSEGGLLSVAFHPNYAENGRFFVNYTTGNF
jgi:hypothetical protein